MRIGNIKNVLCAALAALLLCGCEASGPKIAPVAIESPPPSPQVIDSAVRAARDVIYASARSEIAPLRGAAMESLAFINDPQGGKFLVGGLNDSVASVRFAAAMGIGKRRYEPARGHLLSLIDSEKNLSVRGGVIYALFRLGDGRHLVELGRLLSDESPEVRANAALVIGMTGLQKGARPLTGRLEYEKHSGVKQRIAESLAMLGVGEGFAMLFNYSRVGEPHQQVESITALGLTGDYTRTAPILVWALNDSFAPPQRIAAASALGMLGDARGYNTAIIALTDPQAFCRETCGKDVVVDFAQQSQLTAFAAVALGEIGKLQAVEPLFEYMKSSKNAGLISSAKAILQIAEKNAIALPDLPPDAPNSPQTLNTGNASRDSAQMFKAPPRK